MRIKSLTSLLWKISPNLFFVSIVISGLAGLAYSLLIPFLLYAMEGDFLTPLGLSNAKYSFFDSPISSLGSLFLVALFSIVFFKTLSMILTIWVGSEATLRTRLLVCRKIYSMPTISMDKVGYSNLISLLNIDVGRVSNAAMNLPVIFVSLITIVGVLGYLLYLNPFIFFFVIVCLIIAVITYQIPLYVGSKFLEGQRSHVDVMQAGCRGLVLGSKELKLDPEKFEEYFKLEIETAENRSRSSYIKGIALIIFGENYGEVISMVVVAVVIFHLSFVYSLTSAEVFGSVMALLYLTGPVAAVLGAMGSIEMGKVSLRKISAFLETAVDEVLHVGEQLDPNWSEIKLENISFSYSQEHSEFEFGLNAISARLRRGEITFLVGGNGSGKSTLSRLISTHYPRTKGEIYFGAQSLNTLSLKEVRKSISVIYTDFHVFPALYKDYPQEKIVAFIKYLELDGILEVKNGKFNTVALSDGQKKRVALLTVLLEDRPICIFDEWAADQDPHFKEIFYYKILPELKRQNKLIVVVSHDDRYFSIADQVITMDSGRIRTSPVMDNPIECLMNDV